MDEDLKNFETEITNRLLVIPNLPNELVPEGNGADDNLVVKKVDQNPIWVQMHCPLGIG